MGFTTLYCPNCEEGQLCPVIPLYKFNKKKDRNFYIDEHSDVQWFRRGRSCKKCGHEFLTAELAESFIFELTELRKRLSGKNAGLISNLRKSNLLLSRKESIPKEIAMEFIKASAWWELHPSGPVQAKNHANNIYDSHFGWSLAFGANTFLVGLAIQRCVETINKFLDEFSLGKIPLKESLYDELKNSISGSVANSNGYEYSGYYPVIDGKMMFGTHAIYVEDAIKYMINQTNIADFFL